MRYSANISAGSLKVAESHVVADLLLRGIGGKEWQKAIVEDNVLQARIPKSGIRVGRLIRNRVELMQRAVW